jgi:hypothetical protein
VLRGGQNGQLFVRSGAAAPPETLEIAGTSLASIFPVPKLEIVSDDDRNRASSRDAHSPTALSSADPLRNFSLTVDERIRALTIGVPAWAARKRKIEDDEERYVGELVELHDKLSAQRRTLDQIELALLTAAHELDLSKLNELVKAHNRYYPIEANLPMDRTTGHYLVYGRIWTPEETYTAARLVLLTRMAIERRSERSATSDADTL